MTYNLHPLVVHFPIALLFLYSIIKIFPFARWFPRIAWKDIERIFLVIGILGAFTALFTGETAEHLVRSASNKNLIEMHSSFASASVAIYGILLLAEVLYYLHFSAWFQNKFSKLDVFLYRVQMFLSKPMLSKVLALLGLVTISITGVLGGVLVYGLSADPVAPMLLKFLGLL